MSLNSSNRIYLIFTALLVFTQACGGSQQPQPVEQPETTSMRQPEAPSSSSGGAIAVGHGDAPPSAPSTAPMTGGGSGVQWTAPARWTAGPDKPMRAATYLIPAVPGDSEGGECAVFKDIGGGVAANIERWIGQFEQPDGSLSQSKAKQKAEKINGFNVTTVDLTGIYTAGGMAMGGAPSRKPGYRLLGAIVETPSGEVFFKITGPEKTIAAAQSDFSALLKSIKN